MEIESGCTLAKTLTAGDVFLRDGDYVQDGNGDDVILDGYMVVQVHPVTVLGSLETDLESDPLGRPLLKIRCRDNETGREFYEKFGDAGVVRIEPSPHFVLAGR